VTRVVKQRTPASCGLAALTIYLLDAVMRRIDPKMRGLDGLYNRELLAAAAGFGFALVSTRRFDLDVDEGILRVRWNDRARKKANPDGHFVAVIAGSIHCPDLQVAMPWREYLAAYGGRPTTLLKGSL
jgi:hypothetical protein